MGYERVDMKQKRGALLDHIRDILSNDFGETFNYYEYAHTQFLNMSNRMERLEIQENSNGEIRQCDIFWDGPNEGEGQDGTLDGLNRLGAAQVGSVQGFRVVIHFGVEYDTSGEITNRETFEDLFESHSPKGLLVDLREREDLQVNVGGNDRTILLSNPTSTVFPASPRPLQSGGEEYAHYGEFRIFLTDM